MFSKDLRTIAAKQIKKALVGLNNRGSEIDRTAEKALEFLYSCIARVCEGHVNGFQPAPGHFPQGPDKVRGAKFHKLTRPRRSQTTSPPLQGSAFFKLIDVNLKSVAHDVTVTAQVLQGVFDSRGV